MCQFRYRPIILTAFCLNLRSYGEKLMNVFLCFLGGAISNLYAVLAARHAVLPAVKRKGLQEMPRLVMFESDQVQFQI